jgi:hypothetical protein
VTCPRCGERFVAPAAGGGSGDASSFEAAWKAAEPVPNPVAPSQRRVAGIVLALMGFMAALGLVFALYTRETRRAHDLNTGDDGNPSDGEMTYEKPERWRALGYLPSKVDVIVGVGVAELRQSAAGRDLLASPLTVLPGGEGRLEDLPTRLGLRIADVDHFALGVPSEEPLRSILVVRTVGQVRSESVVAALKAEEVPGRRDAKKLFRGKMKVGASEPTVMTWFADDRTVVFGLSPTAFEDVPSTPRDPASGLSKELQDLLHDRVGVGGPVWAVAHSDDWTKTLVAPLLLTRLNASDDWLRIRSLATWARLEGTGLTIQATADCRDKTVELEKRLRERSPEATIARDGDWLSAQWKSTPAPVRPRPVGRRQ